MQISTFQKFTEKFTEALPASSKKTDFLFWLNFLFYANFNISKIYRKIYRSLASKQQKNVQ
jgi:hypothetical protein